MLNIQMVEILNQTKANISPCLPVLKITSHKGLELSFATKISTSTSAPLKS